MRNDNKNMTCMSCKNGHETYFLDPGEAFCPYFYCHNGQTCSAYVLHEHVKNEKGKKSVFKFRKTLEYVLSKKISHPAQFE